MAIKTSSAHHKKEYQGAKTVDKLDWDAIDHKLGTNKSIPEISMKQAYQKMLIVKKSKSTNLKLKRAFLKLRILYAQTVSFGVILKPPEIKRQIISNIQKEETPFNWENEVPFEFAQD